MGKQAITERALTMTITQAAIALGISEYLTRRLVKEGHIPSLKLGKIIRISKSTIAKILEARNSAN